MNKQKKEKQKTTEELLEEISRKLDLIFFALVLPLIKGKSQQEQIDILSELKLRNKEIAEIVETTPDTVRATISRLKRNKSQVVESDQ